MSAACVAICAGLGVANLADEDDVRVLAEQRAERAGERDADLLVHRHLRDARQLVLDRILDRENLLTPGADHLDRARTASSSCRTPSDP